MNRKGTRLWKKSATTCMRAVSSATTRYTGGWFLRKNDSVDIDVYLGLFIDGNRFNSTCPVIIGALTKMLIVLNSKHFWIDLIFSVYIAFFEIILLNFVLWLNTVQYVTENTFIKHTKYFSAPFFYLIKIESINLIGYNKSWSSCFTITLIYCM